MTDMRSLITLMENATVLLELNDKPVPLQFKKSNNEGFVATFTVGSPGAISQYYVTGTVAPFENQLADYETILPEYFALSEVETMHVDFSNEDSDHPYGISGTGNAFVVFTTVAAIIKAYLETNHFVGIVTFTAHEKSRRRLYSKVVNSIGRFLPGFEKINLLVTEEGEADEERFTIIRSSMLPK